MGFLPHVLKRVQPSSLTTLRKPSFLSLYPEITTESCPWCVITAHSGLEAYTLNSLQSKHHHKSERETELSRNTDVYVLASTGMPFLSRSRSMTMQAKSQHCKYLCMNYKSRLQPKAKQTACLVSHSRTPNDWVVLSLWKMIQLDRIPAVAIKRRDTWKDKVTSGWENRWYWLDTQPDDSTRYNKEERRKRCVTTCSDRLSFYIVWVKITYYLIGKLFKLIYWPQQ